MKIGFIGLGKMGSQMVQRLLQAGHTVVVADHGQSNVQAMAQRGALTASGRQDLVNQLGTPAIVWLMIPATVVDDELAALLPLLPTGSIIIDGGNSDFRETRKRAETCQAVGIQFVDVGTSGGILGLEKGFSMMVGGNQLAFKTVEPIISSLAQSQGYRYFGGSGAGHYIKMVHNAIEYGIMESYAEGYRLLKNGEDYPGLDLAGIADVWQHGSIIASTLNGLAGDVLRHNPGLDAIPGSVAESGEAQWALEVANQQSLEMPAVQAAADARETSQHGQIDFGTKLLAALRNAFGGHAL